MRIFAPQLGLNPDSSSGGEVYDVEILTGLAKRGHHIDVILRKGQKAPNVRNLKIYYLPFNVNTIAYNTCFMPWIFQIPKIKRLIDKADIFRVHSPYFIGLGAVLFRKMVRKCPPLWFHYHHIEKEFKMKVFDKKLPKYADGITVDTDATLKDLIKLCPGINTKHITTINVGTDIDLFRPRIPDRMIKDSLNVKEGERIVLYVGHLIHRKGIDVLMKSWKIIRKDFDDAHLVLIGKGPLEDLVRDYQRSDRKIHIVPYVSTQKDLAKYYNISDVFAFPTRLEGHGMTAAEAMSCEVPVVTTNAKGIKNVVLDGKTGYKTDIDNVEQFSDKLKILLSDASLRKKMGSAGRRFIEENFTWKSSLDKLEKFLEDMLNEK
jgi:phosphatidylinositol alpha-1,6-mannosyltransferase